MTRDEIESVRMEFKRLIDAMVDMARSQGQPLTEILMVQRDAPRTIDDLCNMALSSMRPEAGFPAVPTEAMIQAMADAMWEGEGKVTPGTVEYEHWCDVYRAMLRARPACGPQVQRPSDE